MMFVKGLFFGVVAVQASWFGTTEQVPIKPTHPLLSPDFPVPPSPALSAALTTLSTLSTQPLCHRTASLQLIHDCATLREKTDASILTDSGPAVRDFVDAYAASLAICDLRRGGFVIPEVCRWFTEEVIIREGRGWKVGEEEIEGCLRGLAGGDASWGTWVSYRHRALGFCEAARWDREVERGVGVYRVLVGVLGNLTEGMEGEVGERLERLERRFGGLEKLGERLDGLSDVLRGLENVVGGNIAHGLEKSTTLLTSLLQKASTLTTSLDILTAATRRTTSDLEAKGARAVDAMSTKVEKRMAEVDRVFVTSLASGLQMAGQVALVEDRIGKMEEKQVMLEESFTNLLILSNSLTMLTSTQAALIHNTTQQATTLAHSLSVATTTLTDLHTSTLAIAAAAHRQRSLPAIFSMWPFAVCPATTLMAGSYGLRPSTARNLAMLALGEGLAVGVWLGEMVTGEVKGVLKAAMGGVEMEVVTEVSPVDMQRETHV